MRRDAELLWAPAEDAWGTTRMGRFAGAHAPFRVGDYEALWRWAVDDLSGFWQAVWDFFEIRAHQAPSEVLGDARMPGPVWFPGARMNYAEHMLAGNGLSDTDVAVVAEFQTRAPVSLTLGEMRDQMAHCAAGLRRLGVAEGDRVAGYLPNVPETLMAFLATASLSALWSSCAPEFGTRSVVDRWSQIKPDVLRVVDGYRYGDKPIGRAAEVAEIRAELPSVRYTVLLAYLDPDAAWDDTMSWALLCAPTDEPLTFTPVAFDHPLYVLYSSGTTGLPKPIVHGHGGILVEHLKSLALHLELGPGDRFCWFSTTGWMMWNYLISGLLVGSALVMFDGNPGHPDMDTLWDLVERTGTTYMGVSPPFLMTCRKQGLTPGTDHDLSAVHAMGSTGAPLPAGGFRWVYAAVGDHLQLGSMSGGTDVCAAFVGVIPCRLLGAHVEAYDEDGRPVIGQQGELVITAPMPSMPVGFWGRRLRLAVPAGLLRHLPGRVAPRRLDHHPRGRVLRHHRTVRRHPEPRRGAPGHRRVLRGRGGTGRRGRQPGGASRGRRGRDGRTAPVRGTPARPRGRRGVTRPHRPGPAIRPVPSTRPRRDRGRGRRPSHPVGKKLEVPVKRILQGTPPEDSASGGALADPNALQAYARWGDSW